MDTADPRGEAGQHAPGPDGPGPERRANGSGDDRGMPWRSLLAEATARLRGAGMAAPEVDARRIVERATGTSGAEYVLELDEPATERGVGFFDLMVQRREGGEPLQYVIGQWGFRSLDLFVDRRVLIPRPETEQVVEHALREFDAAVARGLVTRSGPVVDLGTGSGAIALSLAVERERVEVWAVERSAEAALVARANLAGIGRAATRVRVVEGSWFAPLPVDLRGRVAVIVSNPPYVAQTDELPSEVADWEPNEALIPGPTGMEAIREIVPRALDWLAPGCSLVMELAPHQADRAVELARQSGYRSARWERDLNDRPRMLIATAPGDRRLVEVPPG